MQTSPRETRHDGHSHGSAAGLLLWVLLAAAFVVAGYVVPWLQPDNPAAGDIAAAIGAIMLAAPIVWNAARDLLRGHLHMDELVAIAVLASMAQGDFRTAGVISFFMLISMVIETRTAEGAHKAIEGLVRLTPTTARRIGAEGAEEEIAAHLLRPGDRIRLRPGDSVPADGRIDAGRTTLNEATITGESMPAEKGPGDDVFAGTQNLTGAAEIVVTRAGEDTTLGQVRSLIMAAEKTRLPFTALIDRYVGYYTPFVLAVAAFVWFFTGDWNRVVAILVVACPCALILATPTAMVAALSAAARAGILVKNVADLEAVSWTDAVVFDKTGTLTTGELAVARIAPAEGVRPVDLLAAATAAERYSNHPAAQAILRLASESGLPPEPSQDLHEEPGRGVRARIAGGTVLCGRASWLGENGVAVSASSDDGAADDAADLSVVYVALGGRLLGWIGLQDQVRPGAKEAVHALRDLHIRRIAMVTGDRPAAARRVAALIDCPEFRAGCLPQAKVDFVNEVRRGSARVAVVGDGVNDAPALAAGDTGIAMGAAGSDVAIHSATIALMSNDLLRVPFLIRLSRRTRTVVGQNILVGLLFILGGIALSGAGRIPPILAALLHNAGSLIVIFNSGRLIRAGESLK
ncbi:MAG: cation-translocating P-type ATPase [Verrucomicrobia bacterium]|nr:cation-translocating P-type ATPase [Verrucomicrobiota bacterium]